MKKKATAKPFQPATDEDRRLARMASVRRGWLDIRIVDFKEAMSSFATMLTKRQDVRLVFKGKEAKTDGSTIWVPDVSFLARSGLTSEQEDEALKTIGLARAAVYHESSHVLFSNMEAWKEAVEARPDDAEKVSYGQLLNALEDPRIERRLGKDYPGARAVLAEKNEVLCRDAGDWVKAQREMLSEAFRGTPEEPPEPMSKFQAKVCALLCLGHGECEQESLWGQLPPEARAFAMARQRLVFEAQQASSTEGVLEIVAKIWPDLEKDAQAEDNQSGVEAYLKAASWEALEEAVEQAKEHARREARTHAYEDQEEQPYTVLTSESDYTGPAKHRCEESLRDIENDVAMACSGVKRSLQNVLLSRSRAVPLRDLEDGDLDDARLYRLAAAHALPHDEGLAEEARLVFKGDLLSAIAKDVAVGLSIDVSGSMAEGYPEPKDAVARRAALVFGDALNALKVPFEITAWTSAQGGTSQRHMQGMSKEEQKEAQKLYARLGGLHFYEIKPFHKAWISSRQEVTGIRASNGNYDGECVLKAARRLASRRERRKILIVLSDGLPSGDWGEDMNRGAAYLKGVVKRVRATGVELFAVGILSTTVSQFYTSDCVNIDSIEDLPRAVAGHLRQALLKGMKGYF